MDTETMQSIAYALLLTCFVGTIVVVGILAVQASRRRQRDWQPGDGPVEQFLVAEEIKLSIPRNSYGASLMMFVGAMQVFPAMFLAVAGEVLLAGGVIAFGLLLATVASILDELRSMRQDRLRIARYERYRREQG